jgi:hypothetical protein
LACSIQTRLASACRSWATSTWWLANSTAVRTSSRSPPRTPPAPGLRLASRPAAGWHTHSGSRPAGRPAAPARSGPPAPAAVGPRPRSGPRPAPCTSPGRPHPVLGEGGQAWPLAEVALDLLQQLHRRIRGRHPPGLAVLTGQGEAGAIDPDDCAGYLHHPSQRASRSSASGMARSSATLRATSRPSTVVPGLSLELTPRLLLATDGHIPHQSWQPNQAPSSTRSVMAVAAGSSRSPGVAWWWPLRA